MRLTGRYNYFDPYWHPHYHGTDLHSMQSISKTDYRTSAKVIQTAKSTFPVSAFSRT